MGEIGTSVGAIAVQFEIDSENLTGIVTPHIDIHEYCAMFQRYDFDESGTINSVDEMKHLTTNLIFALFMKQIIKNTIDETRDNLAEAADLGPYGLSPREYLEWFRDNLQPCLTFMHLHCSIKDVFTKLGFENELEETPELLKTLKECGVDTADDLAELTVEELRECGMRHFKAPKFHAAVAALESGGGVPMAQAGHDAREETPVEEKSVDFTAASAQPHLRFTDTAHDDDSGGGVRSPPAVTRKREMDEDEKALLELFAGTVNPVDNPNPAATVAHC